MSEVSKNVIKTETDFNTWLYALKNNKELLRHCIKEIYKMPETFLSLFGTEEKNETNIIDQ